MNKVTTYVLLGLGLVASAGRVLGQHPQHLPQMGPPTFAAEPAPLPAPEFCPSDKAPSGPSTTPYYNLCPIIPNGFAPQTPAGNTFLPTWYFGIGPTALTRTGLNRGTVALTGPATGLETDVFPPATSRPASSFQQIPTHFGWGIRGEIGIFFGCNALELSGFYIFQNSTSYNVIVPGRIDVLFGAFPPPPGFSNGSFGNVWLQADQNTLDYTLSLANVELTYRYVLGMGVEILSGFRYLDLGEDLDIFTNDSIGTNSPLARSNYNITTHNRIVAPQFGVELEQLLVPIVSVGVNGKVAVGPNFATVDHSLALGNGTQGPGSTRNEVILSSVIELGMFTNLYLNDNLRLRLGYNAMWVIGIPEAQAQVNFNPNVAAGTVENKGSMFFHGPLVELHFAF